MEQGSAGAVGAVAEKARQEWIGYYVRQGQLEKANRLGYSHDKAAKRMQRYARRFLRNRRADAPSQEPVPSVDARATPEGAADVLIVTVLEAVGLPRRVFGSSSFSVDAGVGGCVATTATVEGSPVRPQWLADLRVRCDAAHGFGGSRKAGKDTKRLRLRVHNTELRGDGSTIVGECWVDIDRAVAAAAAEDAAVSTARAGDLAPLPVLGVWESISVADRPSKSTGRLRIRVRRPVPNDAAMRAAAASVEVSVIAARGLAKMDHFSRTDAYVVAAVGGSGMRTFTVRDALSPRFDATAILGIKSAAGMGSPTRGAMADGHVRLWCYDDDAARGTVSNPPIGVCVVPLAPLCTDGVMELSAWCRMAPAWPSEGDGGAGSILVRTRLVAPPAAGEDAAVANAGLLAVAPLGCPDAEAVNVAQPVRPPQDRPLRGSLDRADTRGRRQVAGVIEPSLVAVIRRPPGPPTSGAAEVPLRPPSAGKKGRQTTSTAKGKREKTAARSRS